MTASGPADAPPAATGRARWLAQPWYGLPVLRVTVRTRAGLVSTLYAVEEVFGGWRLQQVSDPRRPGPCYAVDAVRGTCTCPDASNRAGRQGGCKHVRAMAKLGPLMPAASA